MLAELAPIVAATTLWLTRAFPAPGGALAAALCEAQARQAVTVAARLRYPATTGAGPGGGSGPGGSAGLDRLSGTGADPDDPAWRCWVDEVVASWAAGLLTEPELAARAVARLTRGALARGTPVRFRRLLAPDDHDRRAAVLLRHPDLIGPVAALHRERLLERLGVGRGSTA
ncbi:hypothetical protein U5640_41065 [Streptomyces sp. SS7]|uniref:hypothetical protein n=1 Tax=Streptomyces sp. SS7 TaxID=3108485 RepID=UPI0030ECE937